MEGPYKGLEPYTEADSGYFFGRDVERRIIGANLRAARTTVLYGESGAGKSSLLRAGVAHDFSERPDYALVILRNWRENPVGALLRAVVRTSKQWRGAKTADISNSWDLSSARDLIRALLTIPEARTLLLVLDQFEEYFQYHPNGNHTAAFRELLAYLVLQQDFPLNVLISIREDALASLDTIKVLVPMLFDNCLRVEYLSRTSAAEAITKPLAHYYATEPDTGPPITIDPGSVEQVIDEILSAQGGTSTRVQTPYLQLVMSAWWEREVENGAPVMKYRTLVEDLGGVRNIVDSHLKRTIDSLTPRQQELAARVFEHLVTPTGRKLAQTFSELAESSRISHDQLESILEKFRSARVLSPVPSPHPAFPEERSYEFAHDVMAGVAAEWLRRFRQAEELAAAQREAEDARSRAAEMRELARLSQNRR